MLLAELRADELLLRLERLEPTEDGDEVEKS